MIKKKSQQEIAGFVIIVVVVTVVGLVFLTLSFVKTGKSEISIDMSNLLEASMYYTSDCATFEPNYKSTLDLVKDCQSNEMNTCKDGRKVCEVLNSTLKNIIGESLRVGEDAPNKAYTISLVSIVKQTNLSEKVIEPISQGKFINCSAKLSGFKIIPLDGNKGSIRIDLKVCKGK